MAKRYKHNLGHYNIGAGNMGEIIPISQYDVIPGDTIQQSTNVLVRMSTLVRPVMHPVSVGIFSFFTPNRILDSNFEDMITGAGATPPPTITPSSSADTLVSAMGVNHSYGSPINAYHIYAYNKIRNEFFMDKDIDSDIGLANKAILTACWNKDYFTTIRASAQQGTAVSLPLGDEAPLKYGDVISGTDYEDKFVVYDAATSVQEWSQGATAGVDSGNLLAGSSGNLKVDLSAATGATVSDFMEALAMQSYAEARNRYGETYVDYLRYLGINPRDSRLQRPEYLGGGRSMIQFSEVLNQSATTGDLGDMGGHGIAAVRTPSFRRFIPEHGVINTVMVIRPLNMIVNGVPRCYLKSTKEDYYQHELRNIGDQEVTNKEIYDQHSTPDGIFGYAQRYDEYRFQPNLVCGEMRDAIYDDYHIGRIFTSDPALNSSYIHCYPSERVFADAGTNSNFLFMANHKVTARRRVPREPNTLGGLL